MKLEAVKKVLSNDNYICFTTDLDWAPEIAIEQMLDLFIENNIGPTVFVTHNSEVIQQKKKFIDIGIHPNFVLPSSHGTSPEEIIDCCFNMVPEAKVFRSHRWFASNDIYDILCKKGILYESNICTYMDIIPPFIHRSGMISFPVFFEDGAYIAHSDNLEFEVVKEQFMQNGLKVINIHPMHFALNTPYFSYTREIKDRLSREEWNQMDYETLQKLSYKGNGIQAFIRQLVAFSKNNNVKIVTLKEIYELISE